jgi:subtilisin family serine protease
MIPGQIHHPRREMRGLRYEGHCLSNNSVFPTISQVFTTLTVVAAGLIAFPQSVSAKKIPPGQSVLVISRPQCDVDKFRERLIKRGLVVLNEIRSKTENYGIFEVQSKKGTVQATLANVNASGDFDLEAAEIKFASKTNACVPSINDPEFASQLFLQQMNFSEMRCLLDAKGISQVVQPRITVVDSGVAPISNEMTNITQYNFANGQNGVQETAFDSGFHGTSVACVAAAATNNSLLYTGIASHSNPSVKIISLRTQDGSGNIDTLDVLRALTWCVDNQAARGGMGVINLSINSSALPTYNGSTVVQGIAKSLAKHKDLLVNGAGNTPMLDPSKQFKFIRRVGGIDENDLYWTSSTYGPFKSVAPAVHIRTHNTLTGAPGFGDGTSYSTPCWSGSIALLMSLNPKLTPASADKLIYKTGRVTSQGFVVPDLLAAVIKALKIKP